jgi:molybdate transport system permease protein
MTEALTPLRRESRSSPAARRPGPIELLLSFPFLAFLIVPVAALLLKTSPGQLWLNLGQAQVYQAIGLSLGTSTLAVIVTVVFGTPIAYLMARRRFPFKRAVDTLIDLPTVLPPAVAGVALLMAFGRRGVVGSLLEDLGLHIAFTQAAVVIAQTFIAAPLYLKSAAVGFAGVDLELEQAAALDGASTFDVFRFLTVPLSWTALLSGAVLTFARALGEFGATIIFAGNYPGRTQTMPLAIYLGFELDIDVALTLSVILIGISFLTLIALKVFLQRD